jgi:transposase
VLIAGVMSGTDPELMIRMMSIDYCLGIRSARLLCEDVNLNLAYRWFCKRSINDVEILKCGVTQNV